MIKNLGKFKQWTGERFGGAKVTMQTDDFQKLEQETEHKREGYDLIAEAVDLVESHLLKKRTSPEDNRNKVMPFEALGSCLYHYGTVFPEDSALGIALINLGQTETRIANLQENLAKEIREGYKTTLINGIQEYKEYDSLRKKFASRRLDYDSKLNRLNKAKKEKPELEQEMQAAKIKYQETEHDLIQKMAYIQEFENEHRDALFELVEAQCNYHTQAKDLFQTIKNNWGQGSNADPSNMMDTIIARSNSVQSFHSMSSNQKQHLQQRKSYHFTPESNSSSSSNSINTTLNEEVDVPIRSPLPQHVPPSRRSTQEFIKYRKALFEFNSTNTDEISFKVGDVISVIDEIDKGWWLGEVHSKKGIFPVNYTEDYDPQTQPLPPLPPLSSELEEAPIVQSVNVASLNTVRSRPPPPPSSVSSPVINNIGVSRTKSTAIRPPPPPPSSAVRHNSLDSSPVLQPNNNHTTTILSQNIIHHEPTSYHNEDLSSIRSNSSTTNLETAEPIPCHECECQLQVPNLFKKGYCNNCFHKHRIVQQ